MGVNCHNNSNLDDFEMLEKHEAVNFLAFLFVDVVELMALFRAGFEQFFFLNETAACICWGLTTSMQWSILVQRATHNTIFIHPICTRFHCFSFSHKSKKKNIY